MTIEQPTAIDPAAAAAENAEVRGLLDSTTDNPNPAPLDNPAPESVKTDEPEAEAKPERWDPRAKIIADRKARRAAEEAPENPQGEDLIARDAMGNEIPPFLQKQEPAPETKTETPAPKTYDLKVNGQDVRLGSFDELAKAAGLEPAEAKDLPEAALLKAARITLAAEARLAAAKEQARQSERAPATPADQSDTTQTDPEQPRTKAPAKAKAKELIEKIQFAEDPEEAAAELEAYLSESVSQVLDNRDAANAISAVKTEVGTAVRSFEDSNKDIFGDEDMTSLFYGRYLIDAVKDALVATGQITREAADRHVTDTQSSLDAYEAVRLGKLKVSDPSSILNAAAEKFRTKFAKPTTPATTSVPQVNSRVEAKRALTPQPTRAAAPLPVTPATAAEDRHKNAVHQMRVRRGLVPRGA